MPSDCLAVGRVSGRVCTKSEGGAARAQWSVHVRRCVSMASGFVVCVGALAISLMMESTRVIPRPSAAGVGIAAAAVAAARARYTGLG